MLNVARSGHFEAANALLSKREDKSLQVEMVNRARDFFEFAALLDPRRRLSPAVLPSGRAPCG